MKKFKKILLASISLSLASFAEAGEIATVLAKKTEYEKKMVLPLPILLRQ